MHAMILVINKEIEKSESEKIIKLQTEKTRQPAKQ